MRSVCAVQISEETATLSFSSQFLYNSYTSYSYSAQRFNYPHKQA